MNWRSPAQAASSSIPFTWTRQASPSLTSAATRASTLLRLATAPLRWLVRAQSDAKRLAASARWLAGLACSPFASGKAKLNSRGIEGSGPDLLENRFGVPDGLLHGNLDDLDAVEPLPLFDLDIHGEDGDLGLADVPCPESSFSMPMAPCVSTLIWCPRALAVFSSCSAAM